MSEALLEMRAVKRHYGQGETRLEVLREASLSIAPGEIVALTGPSGAGKSTLLHVAGLLEDADGGEVFVKGEACSGMSELARTLARRRQLGFVYQFHHLLPEFSAVENIVVPQLIAGRTKEDARTRAMDLLDRLGVGARADHRPGELSGGEQQRVALARAVANQPALLLADEPTGNLDHHTADSVFDALAEMVRDLGLGALIATHNMDLAARMDRRLSLVDGHIQAA